jgi:hypothetical protein
MRIAAGLMLVALVASCATPAPGAPASQTVAAAAPKTAPAAKTAAAPAAGKALVKEAGDKRVCRRQTEIGSNFPKRVCKSATEWAAYDKANLEGVEQYKRDSQQNTAASPMAQ